MAMDSSVARDKEGISPSCAFLHIEVGSLYKWIKVASDMLANADDTLVANGEVFGDKKWLFRGQANAGWPITSSLERTNQVACNHLRDPERYFRAIERFAIEEFKRQAHALVESDNLSNLKWMMLMRHHGVPTRLVDFTEIPLYALFFALEDDSSDDFAVWAVARDAMKDWYAQSKIGSRLPEFDYLSKNFTQDQLNELVNRNESNHPAVRSMLDFVRAFKHTKDNAYKRIMENRKFAERIFSADLDDFLSEAKNLSAIYLYAERPNVRQRVQRGLFLMSTCMSTSFMNALKGSLELPEDAQPIDVGLEESKADGAAQKANIKDARLIQFVFKSSLRKECRDFLRCAGISPSSIYPDLHGISVETKQLILQGLNPSHDFTEIFNKHLSESRAKGKIDLPNSMPDNPSKPRKGFH